MSDALRILHGEFGRAMLVRVNRSLAEHAHRTCQLLFKVDGPDVEVTVGGKRFLLSDENVVMFNAWEQHSIAPVAGGTPVTLFGLHVEPTWLKALDSRLACSMHPSFFRAPSGPIPNEVRDSVRKLLELVAFESDPNTHEVELLVLNIILAVTSAYSDIKSLSSVESIGGIKCDARIRKALSLMRDTIGTEVVLEDIARNVGMSRPHFFHLFRRDTGLTPMAYFSMLRMDAAIKQIAETHNSLLDISLQLGFGSPGNFTRFFNVQNGITPSQYRRCVSVLEKTEQAANARHVRVAA